MAVRLTPTDYQQVFAYIQAQTGLRVHSGRFDEIAYVVNDVIASLRMSGVDDLLLALRTTTFIESLWQIFIQAITVGETYFFRDQGQIEALRSHILPEIIAEHQRVGSRQLRLWSAGCASGEEPYTLLMLLQELLPDISQWEITVLGTDINLYFLERARRGLYRPSSFRSETPDYVQKRWFRQTSEGFLLDQAIRDQATFLPYNLANPLTDSAVLNMDLIVCRNVTIYFEQPTVSAIVSRFYQALNEGGRLVVGHSELSTTLYHEFATRTHERTVYYQKTALPQPQRSTMPAAPRPVSRPAAGYPFPRTPVPSAAAKTAQPAALTRTARPVSKPVTGARPSTDHGLEIAWARAKEAADRERWEEALAFLTQVENTYRFRPEFHYLHGLVHLAAENTDKAIWAWRQALYCDPMFALAHYSLGDLYEQRGESKAAVRHWRQAMSAIAHLDPQHRLLFSEDLTVEMLKGLLAYRVSVLPGGNGRER